MNNSSAPSARSMAINKNSITNQKINLHFYSGIIFSCWTDGVIGDI